MPPRRKAGKGTRQPPIRCPNKIDGDREGSPPSPTQDKDQSVDSEKSPPRTDVDKQDTEDGKGLENVEKDDDNISIVIPPPRILHTGVKTPKKATGTATKVAGRPTPKKKRKPNNIPFPFLPDQEKDLAEWFRDNPCFYNKRSKEYRYTQIKKRKIEEKAKDYKDPEGDECTADQLLTWMSSMRTYYGKLSKQPKSGTGTEGGHKLTERELWIQQSFNFLSEHIVRIPGRLGCKLTSKETEEPELGDDDGLDVLSIQDTHNSSTLQDLDSSFEVASTTNTGNGKGQGKTRSKSKKTPDESDIETIEKICSTILKTAAPIPRPTSPRSTELENFGRDIVCSMRRVPEERWNDVKVEIMMVIRNFSGTDQLQPTGLGIGYSATAQQPPFHSNYNLNIPPRYNRAGSSHAHYRAPTPIANSSSQYVQQTQQWQQPQPPALQTPGPELQYMQLVTTSLNTTDNTSATTATGNEEGDILSFNNE